MQMCQQHWDTLRQEVIDQGLGEWIASSGETAVAQLVDQLNRGENTKVNYDPLMSSWFMIMSRVIEGVGLPALAPDFGCPICRLQATVADDGSCNCGGQGCPNAAPGSMPDFESWLVGPDSCVTAAREHMIAKGWIEAER
jgi:hypothetical protein